MGTTKEFRNLNVRGTATVNNTFTASSDATVTGTLTASGVIANAVQTALSTGTTLNKYGLSLISSTKAGTLKFVLAAPVAGVRKTIIASVLSGSSSVAKVITNSTAVTIISTGGATRFGYALSSSGESVELMGYSATNWRTIQAVGATGSTTR